VAVCRAWAIQGAGDQALTLDCAQHSTDVKGTPVSAGTLGFVSCAINQSTFKTFTENDFTGLETLTNLLGSADASTGVAAAAMAMTASTWQCKEVCSRSECEGGQNNYDERRLNGAESKVESSENNDDEDDKPHGRRLGKRRHRSGNSCTKTCVEWRYSRALLPQVPPTEFNDMASAQAVCGDPPYPTETAPVKLGSSDVHASAGQVKTSPGNVWSLNELQMQVLPINLPVALPRRAAPEGLDSATSAPFKLTLANTFVEGNAVKTCRSTNFNSMGCVEIRFQKAAPAHATMLGAVDTIPGRMSKEGWTEAEYWVCKGSHANHIDRFCPATNKNADAWTLAHKGDMSCGEDIDTIDELFDLMKNANYQKTMLFRLLGFLAFWCSFNFCFQPIESALAFATDMMDDATDCIPCVGGAVDWLTDLFMGMVKSILCVVSCCCAMGWFLSVAVVMWMVMRPVIGAALAVVACCFCGGAALMLKMCSKKGKKLKDVDDDDSEDNDGDEEYDNE